MDVTVELTAEEGRVLGCLVEKQLTTPQHYPLTDNALVAACNQATSRDPVVQYDVPTVRLAVRSLRDKQLVRTVHRSGERSDKHRHELAAALGLSPAEVAVLALLLLRGPQTAAELRLRAERMHEFASVTEVEQVLAELAGRQPPLVVRLERQPGRREDRYAELLVATAGRGGGPAPEAGAPGAGAPGAPGVQALAREVAELREELAAVRAQVERLTAAAQRPGPVSPPAGPARRHDDDPA